MVFGCVVSENVLIMVNKYTVMECYNNRGIFAVEKICRWLKMIVSHFCTRKWLWSSYILMMSTCVC